MCCGTDFSPAARRAADVAAVLAKRLLAPLELIHASELPASPAIRKAFREEVARVRRTGVVVSGQVVDGNADEALVARADPAACRLVVVSALGKREPERWVLGSVSERTAERAAVPTLVVRDAGPFEAWTRDGRALRVFVAFDATAESDAALSWVAELSALGRCEVVLGYIDWPPEQRARLGGAGSLPLVGNLPDVQAVLERDLHARAAAVLGEIPFRLRIEANWGRPDARLAQMAAEEDSDLVVVGSHQYGGFERLWHASVSRGLLHAAKASVAVVPLARAETSTIGIAPAMRRVLVGTDFSAFANAAIPYAYSLVRGGGTVHLVHVTGPQAVPVRAARLRRVPSEFEALRAQHVEACGEALRALVPVDAGLLGIATDIAVIEHDDVSEALLRAAARYGVDAICLGTHGRTGAASVLFGSVTRGVMARSTRPVLTVRTSDARASRRPRRR